MCTLGIRCSLRSKYSDNLLIFFSVEMPRGLVQLGSVTGKIAGTKRLYLLTGTLAAAVGPKQLQLQSIVYVFGGIRVSSFTTFEQLFLRLIT